jgi:benzoate/toluate 1,2-dioxygenase reductase subunit
MNRIALNFEDGVTRFIDVRPDELVADAAYRLGLNIPMDCRDGACGTCKCHCESGDYSLGDYIEDAMTPEEAEQGYVLTCQMKAKSDCIIAIPASSAVCKTKPSSVTATMVEVRHLSDSTIGFSVRPEEGHALSYLPGQYVNVSVPGSTQTRSYSFSAMMKEGTTEFLVRNIPGGLMSSYLASKAQPGDVLTLTGPIGSFYLRAVVRPLLFLAGGTGLAPFLAMLDHLQAHPVSQPIHLIYGVTHDADLVEVDGLQSYAGAIPGFTFTTVVADQASTHERKGFVTHHLPEAALFGGDVDVYLCGPPPMVDAVRAHFTEMKIEPAHFYFEKFNPSESK